MKTTMRILLAIFMLSMIIGCDVKETTPGENSESVIVDVVTDVESNNDDIQSNNNNENISESVEKVELPDEIIKLFENCSMYMDSEYNMDDGNILASKEYTDILDFLFYLQCDDVEEIQNFDSEHETMIHRISYDNWSYLLKEVYGENNPEIVAQKLSDYSEGEISVYYNQEDGYIYQEAGMVSLYEFYTELKGVTQKENGYAITYDVYSVFSGYDMTVEVTIIKADNKYGYKLADVEIIDS